jgi:cbb3-type cytochrome oxidase cytochrome c subunit
MPATEETYRRQPSLHIVFAVSSVAMLLATLWMIMADHLRPWKTVQREFHAVETTKLEAAEKQKNEELQAKHSAALAKVDEEIASSKKLEVENRDKIRQKEKELKRADGKYEEIEPQTRFKKVELDSKRSEYDLIIDKGETAAAIAYTKNVIVPTEKELRYLEKKLEAVVKERDDIKAEIALLKGNIDERTKQREEITRDLDRVKRTLAQKEAQYFGPLAIFRGLPVIDLAAPPEKIQQISLPDLTINYNFKDVPRYDRCQTCHMGIDKLGYDKDAEGKPMRDSHPAFAAHPHLTDGATAIDPKGDVVTAGLYLDGSGPHKINSFGCTICHGGQGSGTSFTFASHTPNDLHQREEWVKKHGWEHIHFWDEPMLPKRFLEASCLKCHHQVTDVPQAKKLQAGYQRITKFGCTGCHTIGGEGAFGPDLTDNRQVGPNLAYLGSKVTKDWATRWIRNPHIFRPDTRMPRFYDVTNNDSNRADDRTKVQAEVHAMAHYLFAVSSKPDGFTKPEKAGNAEKGKTLFFEKGCLACHAHQDFAPDSFPKSVQQYTKANFGPNLSNVAAKFTNTDDGHAWLANWIKAPEAYHPKSLMPNLQLSLEDSSDIAAWLMSVKPEMEPKLDKIWNDPAFVQPIDAPDVQKGLDSLVKLYISKAKTYNSKPILLSEVDSTVAGMSRDEKLMYVGEKTISRLGCFGCHNIPGFADAKPIGTPLNGWGIKGAAKLDFGHIAEYLDNSAQRDDRGHVTYDGTDEYYKDKVEEHTREGFLYQKLHRPRSFDFEKNKEDIKTWDDRLRMPQFSFANDPQAIEEVMTFVLGLTGEKIAAKYLPHYTPAKAAIAQGERLLERFNCRGCHVLQMPKYTIDVGTKITDALVDLKTNIEGSYGRRNDDYLSFYKHLPGYTFDANVKGAVLEESLKIESTGFVLVDSAGKSKGNALKAFIQSAKGGKTILVNEIGRELTDPTKKYLVNEYGKTRIVDAQQKDADPKGELFLIDKDNAPVDRKAMLVIANDAVSGPITFEAMPTDMVEDESEPGKVERRLALALWRPLTIRGFTFNVRDNLTVNPDKLRITEAEGGNFAWLFARTQADKAGTDYATFWNRLPPPLLRQGKKVQSPWLTAFLKDPYAIRPAVNLRMPRFHLGNTLEPISGGPKPLTADQFDSQMRRAHEAVQKDAADLANFFAAVDGAEFPYQSIPERDRDYLAAKESKHPDYLGGGWTIITKGLCVQCHNIGQFKAGGGDNVVNGPDLRQVGGRFQPDYLAEWLGNPARLVPYTAMPQNVPPHPAPGTPPPTNVPKSFEGDQFAQVQAMRDLLLNYVTAVEQQLATAKPADGQKPPEEKKPTSGGN